MHELDYSSRSLMQLCKTRHPFCSIPRGYLIASALLLRAAYDSPGVTCLDVRSPHVGVFRRKCAVTQGILRGRSTRSSWCPQSRKAGVPGSHVTDCPAAKCARQAERLRSCVRSQLRSTFTEVVMPSLSGDHVRKTWRYSVSLTSEQSANGGKRSMHAVRR